VVNLFLSSKREDDNLVFRFFISLLMDVIGVLGLGGGLFIVTRDWRRVGLFSLLSLVDLVGDFCFGVAVREFSGVGGRFFAGIFENCCSSILGDGG